jgi:hypothetical protein
MPPSVPPLEEPAGVQPLEPSSTQALPYLRFYHSAELRDKTLSIVRSIERAQDPSRYRNTLADVVMELTDAGLNYFFLRALDLAKANFVIKQSAHIGIGSVNRIMGPVVHNIIGKLDKQQLLIVCGHIRALMD